MKELSSFKADWLCLDGEPRLAFDFLVNLASAAMIFAVFYGSFRIFLHFRKKSHRSRTGLIELSIMACSIGFGVPLAKRIVSLTCQL